MTTNKDNINKDNKLRTYVIAALTGSCVIVAPFVYFRHYRRIPSAEYFTPKHLNSSRYYLRGRVVRVPDGDNFRFYHNPSLYSLFHSVPTERKALQGQTINVRLAGVDAPELPHFGKPEQPYAREALEYLKSLILNKTVTIQPLKIDQYGRAVSHVWVRKFPYLWSTVVSKAMLKAGFATVYTQSGAEYGDYLKQFQNLEEKAKRRRHGMWAQKNYESPADFKERHK